jgi:Protein of unknown function (DUF998)
MSAPTLAVASIASALTLISMSTSLVLAIVSHFMRRDLSPIEKPLSAYLSGGSRRVGLACYAALALGIASFAVASAMRAPFGNLLGGVLFLYVLAVAFILITAVTARTGLSLGFDENPRVRWWHRKSAYAAFLAAIIAIVLHTWLWRNERFLRTSWPLLTALSAIMVGLFLVLPFVPVKFNGAVQKFLILCVLAWFSWVALLTLA